MLRLLAPRELDDQGKPTGEFVNADAAALVAERETADYFEAALKHGGASRDARVVANWINGDLAAFANAAGLDVARTHITPAQIAGIVDLIGAHHKPHATTAAS